MDQSHDSISMSNVRNCKRRHSDEEDDTNPTKRFHHCLRNVSEDLTIIHGYNFKDKNTLISIANSDSGEKLCLIKKLSTENYSVLNKILETLHDHITSELPLTTNIEENIVLKCVIETTGILYVANVYHEHKKNPNDIINGVGAHSIFSVFFDVIVNIDMSDAKIPLQNFVHEQLSHNINANIEFSKWNPILDTFSLVTYRFLLMACDRAQFYSLWRKVMIDTNEEDSDFVTPLELRVDRNNLVQSSLRELRIIKPLEDDRNDTYRKLEVKFEGEGGDDHGGPTKEYIQLVFRELMVELKDTLICKEDNNILWFDTLQVKDLEKLQVLGFVIGMALDNNVALNLQFPATFYKSLFNFGFEKGDIELAFPSFHRAFESILEYEGEDIADTFDTINFSVSYHTNIENDETYQLRPDEENISLTQKNKYEFVSLYTEFILDIGVRTHISNVLQGLYKAIDMGEITNWLSHEDIREVLSTQTELNMVELQNSVSYIGYDAHSQYIKNFWEVVHDFNEEQKRRLLNFVTGNETLPIGGVTALNMTIRRTSDPKLLPTSSTCFNILYLPKYCNMATLKEKLLILISNSLGFGFE